MPSQEDVGIGKLESNAVVLFNAAFLRLRFNVTGLKHSMNKMLLHQKHNHGLSVVNKDIVFKKQNQLQVRVSGERSIEMSCCSLDSLQVWLSR